MPRWIAGNNVTFFTQKIHIPVAPENNDIFMLIVKDLTRSRPKSVINAVLARQTIKNLMVMVIRLEIDHLGFIRNV